MIVLNSTQRRLELDLTGSTSTTLSIVVNHTDVRLRDSLRSLGSQLNTSNGTTDVIICPAPANGVLRLVNSLSVVNTNNTATATARIYYDENGTEFDLSKVALASGDQLFYEDNSGWSVLNSAGVQKTGANVTPFPTGSVVAYAADSEPSGWLFCYAQAISRTTFSELFSVIGTAFGTGDGSTTFNLPDLRGRVIAGQDDMGGTSANRLTGVAGSVNGDTFAGTGGVETHTLTSAEMPAHTHDQNASSAGSGGSPGTTSMSSSTNNGSGGLTDSTGDGGAHNNVQPTMILNYIIKT